MFFRSFEINGLNLDRLINTLKKQGVGLYDLKKLSNKRLRVTINYADSEKFFAITKKLCYNVKKLKLFGKTAIASFLFRNVGVIIGCLIFLIATTISNDFIYSVTFEGSGSVYQELARNVLDENGVGELSRFSSLDLKKLSSKILASCDRFSFVSCEKHGNNLKINLVLAEADKNSLTGNVKDLYADVCGVVEKIKVYRGTAEVNVGDYVNAGDLLIGGYAIVKDQTVQTTVVAFVSIITERVCEYYFASQGYEEQALLLAEGELGAIDSVSTTVEVSSNGGGYVYKVVTKYRRIFYVG